MRKIALMVAVIFAAALLVPQYSFAKEYKIGFIDLAKVFDESPKTKDADKVLEEKGKALSEERKKLLENVRNLKDEQLLLSDKAKAEKQAVIEEKTRELQEFDTKAREDMLRLRNDNIGTILKEIETIVTDYAKKEKFDIILNSRMLLYGNEQLDLTPEVLKKLKK